MLIVALIVLNVPVYLLLGWLFFDNWAKFFDTVQLALRTLFTPAIVKLFLVLLERDEESDGWSVIQLAVFLVCCAAAVVFEYQFIVKRFL